jgi:hypothetical protein
MNNICECRIKRRLSSLGKKDKKVGHVTCKECLYDVGYCKISKEGKIKYGSECFNDGYKYFKRRK